MSETRLVRRPATRPATTEDIEFAAAALDLPDQSAYLGYYGLRSVPFRASADPKYLWLGPRQRRVLDTLATAVGQGAGVVLLTGEMGTGKTSLVNGLADRLSGSGFAVARLPGVGLDAADVLVALAGALRLPGAVPTKGALLSTLDRIAPGGSSPRTVVLIIDEAQSLGPEVLRELGELASAAAVSGCPLCIVLVGQTELTWELADQRHAELRQHVTTRCALDPLSASEVGQYVRHCLELAGAGHEIFGADAIEEIAALSRGAPAAINSICEHALLTGHRRQLRVIGRSVIAESRLSQRSRQVPRPPMMRPVGRRARAAGPAARAVRRSGRPGQRAIYVALAVGITFVGAGGYSLHAGWLARGREAAPPRSPEHSTASVQPATPRKTEPPVPPVPEVALRPEPVAPISAQTTEPESPTGAAETPSATRPAVTTATRTRPSVFGHGSAAIPAVPRRRAVAPSAPAEPKPPLEVTEHRSQPEPRPMAAATRRTRASTEPDAADPGGVIDWLIKEHVPAHR